MLLSIQPCTRCHHTQPPPSHCCVQVLPQDLGHGQPARQPASHTRDRWASHVVGSVRAGAGCAMAAQAGLHTHTKCLAATPACPPHPAPLSPPPCCLYTDVAHLRDPAFLVRALRYRSARLLHTLAARLRKHSRRLGCVAWGDGWGWGRGRYKCIRWGRVPAGERRRMGRG